LLKNYRFEHTCNEDNDIGRRKQQKLDYRIFTGKFPISSSQCQQSYLLFYYFEWHFSCIWCNMQ